jgi:hypothetical protein
VFHPHVEIEAKPPVVPDGFGYGLGFKVGFATAVGKGMNLKRREWRRSKMI